MSKHYVEQRALLLDQSLSWDIAHHLYVRQFRGNAVILTDDPATLMPAVKKQWQKVARLVTKERASTLRPDRVAELIRQHTHMRRLRFSADRLAQVPSKSILLATPQQLLDRPLTCDTLYVACAIDPPTLALLQHNLRPHGLMVVYATK